MRFIDDGTALARQISKLINVDLRKRAFTDSRPLLELIGSFCQIEEKV